MIRFENAKAIEKKYCEQVVGGAMNRGGYVVDCEHEWSIDYDLYGTPLMGDSYCSAFTFGSELKEFMDKNKTIKGYDGSVLTGYIHFDFDSDVDVSSSQRDVVELLSRLEEIGIDVDASCRIYFSGEQ